MRKLSEIEKDLDAALAAARDAFVTQTHDKQKVFTDRVVALQAERSDLITEGAKPCRCGGRPHGIKQPRRDGKGFEFEIRCIECNERMRGGLLPRHTVEGWNEKMEG